ncbi:unnamed protein product [Amaranthus hypochondriacus]
MDGAQQVVVNVVKEDDRSSSRKLVGTNIFMLLIMLMFGLFAMIAGCITVPLALSIVPLVLSCILILSLAIFPLLLISILMVRLFQFIRHGDGFEKLVQVKTLIRGWLYLDLSAAVFSMWCFFPLFKYVPKVKQVTIFDLSFTKWTVLISIIYGLYFLSFILYMGVHQLLIIVLNFGIPQIAQALTEIIDSLIFWWAVHEVIKKVPSCRNHEILGLSTRKWITVTVLVIIGYNLIFLCVQLTVSLLRKLCCGLHLVTDKAPWQKFVIHCIRTTYLAYIVEGMKWSVCIILRSLLIMLVWILYFGSHLNLNGNKAENIWELGKWSFVSLLIFSVLWFIKTAVLLAWDVHTIYDRFKPMILSRSEKLYYLSILCMNKHETLQPAGWVDISTGIREDSIVDLFCFNLIRSMENPVIEHIVSIKKMEKIKNNLVETMEKTDPTIDDIQQAIQYFLVAKKALSKETYISDILKNFDSAGDNRETLEKIFASKVDDDKRWNPGVSDVEEVLNKEDKQHSVSSVLFTFTRTYRMINARKKMEKVDDHDDSIEHNLTSFVGMLQAIKQSNDTSEFSIYNIQKWVVRQIPNFILMVTFSHVTCHTQ